MPVTRCRFAVSAAPIVIAAIVAAQMLSVATAHGQAAPSQVDTSDRAYRAIVDAAVAAYRA